MGCDAYQKDLADTQTSLQESHVKIEKLGQQSAGLEESILLENHTTTFLKGEKKIVEDECAAVK